LTTLANENISFLRMSQYESRVGQFLGWDDHRRTAFISRLSQLVQTTLSLGVAHSLVMRDYRTVLMPFVSPEVSSRQVPYLFLMEACLEDIAKYMRLPSGAEISCVCEQEPGVQGGYAEYFSYLQRTRLWANVFRGIAFEPKVEDPRKLAIANVGLQAADMLAYENYKHVTNQVINDSTRPIRKLLLSLAESRRLVCGYFDRRGLEHLVRLGTFAESHLFRI
jgi:hypothetical protein